MVDADVKAALESLPEHFRLPVILADVEGFSYKEIAEIMDIPSEPSCLGCIAEEERSNGRCGNTRHSVDSLARSR